MSESRARVTPDEAEVRFKRYHDGLKAQGRTCSCCLGKIDADEAEAGYKAAKQEAEAVEDRYRKVKGATAI